MVAVEQVSVLLLDVECIVSSCQVMLQPLAVTFLATELPASCFRPCLAEDQ